MFCLWTGVMRALRQSLSRMPQPPEPSCSPRISAHFSLPSEAVSDYAQTVKSAKSGKKPLGVAGQFIRASTRTHEDLPCACSDRLGATFTCLGFGTWTLPSVFFDKIGMIRKSESAHTRPTAVPLSARRMCIHLWGKFEVPLWL